MIEIPHPAAALFGVRGWNSFIFLALALVFQATCQQLAAPPDNLHHSGGHSEPQVGLIPIIDIGADYILGQLETGHTLDFQDAEGMNHSSESPHSRTLAKLDGPVQCSKDQPCIDESCCNRSGKCGSTDAHCAPEVCEHHCNATAPCGINSEDKKTKCGLGLCCSYYGWCGFEPQHCKDPEPQYGKVSESARRVT
jgi:hypothetical protein